MARRNEACITAVETVAGSTWLEYYAHLDPDNTKRRFSKRQEAVLAAQVQAGIVARKDGETEDNRAIIDTGEQARKALFDVNVPFALYMARESVGMKHLSSQMKLAQVSFRRVGGSSSGTWRPLASLKSPYADLEHREQSALEGLWEASASFQSQFAELGEQAARFSTYAAYVIQNRIERDIAAEEHPAHLPDSYDVDTPLTSVGLREHAYEEGDDVAEKLADIWPDTRDTVDVEAEVDRKMLGEKLHEMLSALPDLDEKVIRMQFGLLAKRETMYFNELLDLDKANRSYTFNQISEALKIPHERTRYVASKVMSRLQDPVRNRGLRDWLDA